MPRPLSLSQTQKNILSHLSRVMFCTFDQIQYWMDIGKPATSEAIKVLAKHNLVKLTDKVKPHIVQLTHSGARVSGTTLSTGKTFYSWSAKVQRIYRNDAEILLRGVHRGFTMQSRKHHLSLGLNPSHGENAGVDIDKKVYFCLVDDYRMKPDRLMHAWTRQHTPNKLFFDSTHGFKWSILSDHYCFFSTDADALSRFKSYNEGKGDSALPVSFYYLKPRWH